jgi:hypothetical protein
LLKLVDQLTTPTIDICGLTSPSMSKVQISGVAPGQSCDWGVLASFSAPASGGWISPELTLRSVVGAASFVPPSSASSVSTATPFDEAAFEALTVVESLGAGVVSVLVADSVLSERIGSLCVLRAESVLPVVVIPEEPGFASSQPLAPRQTPSAATSELENRRETLMLMLRLCTTVAVRSTLKRG